MESGRTTVDGRFELIEPLGSGGMGTVWRAYDLALHREVALKEVRPAEGDGKQRERVLREARALARISHRNVVAIHHIVDTPAEQFPWIVMELIRGRSLSEHLAVGPMHPARAAQIGRGILAGLRAAHAVGVLHRDIKPANVLMREDDSPVLTDFGIAAMAGNEGLTSTGVVIGSLDYLAPERLNGIEGHPASDLWSLGMLLFTAVEGYQPMHRETSVATLAAIMQGTLPPARHAGPLSTVLQALLVTDPDHRPPAEVVDNLLAHAVQSATSGAPMPHLPSPTVTSRPLSPAQAASPRNRGLAVVATVVVVAAATIAGLLLWPKSGTGGAAEGQPATTAQSGGTALVRPGSTALVAPGGTVLAGPATTDTPDNGLNNGDLLTPDGIRKAVTALEQLTGGQQFTETTIYPAYLSTGVPVKDQPTLYDEYTYRDGRGSRTGPGGELSTKTVALRSIDWDVIPTLLQTAEAQLGIPHPTNRYLIIDPEWTFNDDKPTIRVYLTDDYGGAYLAADVDGTVVTVMPRK
ncbi:serine/threonine-protein kinase [Nocardia sp. alder85J]|uniref:serine/threonine-protein kinase n=1 Tax=Nocardia sp. alder85J TaxID=2862949 RepID=UPI001CD5BE53|nr:serine/threonine-protein kinase [Nocardia sp. alder85J]MCX4096078.1 serine/threonine-protein kinase [Nocardia sp. alder85J]